ncbi:hypothetical protein K458DRAFT_418848 [Lentithecium fluviatile CBS 122367]|uniref:Uncharacterized protein n=1 Tax=Lentithecium fluviatile CBS 122367 TaxID=1168545 RepID=A0A6G1J0Z3_9PLEO|nr:hypothetical protein K458DRAFT_418848 [Lentithecium fluviatile CBS 122367]
MNKDVFQPRPAGMKPFTSIFGDGNVHQKENRPLPSYRYTPTGSTRNFNASSVPMEKFRLVENELKSARGRNRQLDDLNRRLEVRIRELEARNRDLEQQFAQITIPGCAFGPQGDVFVGNFTASNLRYSPPKAASPVAIRNGRSYRRLSPSAPPYTPTTYRDPIDPPVMTGISPPTVRRRKRTETPEQLSPRKFTHGVPIFTFGIDLQNDRGLLHDFFDDVRKWATFHTKDRDAQEAGSFAVMQDLVDMTAGKSDIEYLLMDSEMRRDIVACLVARHIVMNAMGEHFLWNSGHHAGSECNNLFLEFAHLQDEEYGRKQEVCEKQQALYTKLKNEPGHKKWRTFKAEEYCEELLNKIGFLLEPYANTQRAHVLSELYVKGYWIGFRLRMEAVKWQIMWPTAGTDLNLGMMVNQTRNLLGDPMETFTELQKDPKKFFVRFALTPTISKSDFSSGTEEKTVVHSSMVHVGRKGVFNHKTDASK